MTTTTLDGQEPDQDKLLSEWLNTSMNYIARYSGRGSETSKYLMTLSKLNRFGTKIMERNHENSGITLFTRPMMNLSEPNLKMDRTMSMLNTSDPNSILFSIRCYLDSMMTNSNSTDPRLLEIRRRSRLTPYFNYETPFIFPLSNQLSSIDGFPDYNLDTETTDVGYQNEDQTIATGADFGNKTYDLSVSFYDIKGGYIFSMFYYMLRYIALITKGPMLPYPMFEDSHALDYSQSIYRLVLDPTKRIVRKCAKCTGCYPVSMTIGSVFNVNENEHFIHSSENVTVNYKANHIEYIDPAMLLDLNILSKRFCPDIDERIISPMTLQNNFTGLPYMDLESGKNYLNWMCLPEELEDTEFEQLQILKKQIDDLTNPYARLENVEKR